MGKEKKYLSNNYKNLIIIVISVATSLILNFIINNTFYNLVISISVALLMYYFAYYSKYKNNFKSKYYFEFFKESYLAAAIFNVGVLFIGISYNKNNSLLIMGIIFLLVGVVGHRFFKN